MGVIVRDCRPAAALLLCVAALSTPGPCEAQDRPVWVGTGSCAATACHGGRREPLDLKGSEYGFSGAYDPHGRAYQVLHVLREHRGSAHIVAVLAAGLTPFQAHYGKLGEDGLKSFGWRDWRTELLDIAGLEDRLGRAEALTNELITPAFATLNNDEADEFAALVDAAHAHVTP